MIKIAIVGTHGVGKTALAFELSGVLKRRGKTVELVTEIARECPLPLNEKATREAFQWVIARQVQLEIEKSLRAEVVVCDRSVLDNYAYYLRLFGSSGQEAEALEAYCRAWMRTYSLLVRLPVLHPLVADGFRSTDVSFQREIDRICDELFEKSYGGETSPAYVRGDLSARDIAAHQVLGGAARERGEGHRV